jgi:hypothetical protein
MAYEYELSNHKNSEEIHLQLCRNTLYIYTYVFAEKYISGGGQKAATHAGKDADMLFVTKHGIRKSQPIATHRHFCYFSNI